MSSSPFKNFLPYLVKLPAEALADLDVEPVGDPSGGQWSTIGFVAPFKGEPMAVDLQGSGYLMTVQFNNRVLPAKVRNDALDARIAKLESLQGRKASKKDFAELRDQVEFDLLPKAFIRRSTVPVLFRKDMMLICTSSQRKADDIASLLVSTFPDLAPWPVQTKLPPGQILTDIAYSGSRDGFTAHDSAVLRGEGKRTIRIKNKGISDGDIHDLIDAESYSVRELGMWTGTDPDNPDITFSVSASLAFRSVELPNIQSVSIGKDLFGFTVLCAQSFTNLVRDFVEVCGGMADRPDVPASANNPDEDDEL